VRFRYPRYSRHSSYTIKVGPFPFGDPALHHYIGEIYYKGRPRLCKKRAFSLIFSLECSFIIAERHFLHAASKDASRLFGKMMAEWYVSTSDSKVSAGAFATHGTIPCVYF